MTKPRLPRPTLSCALQQRIDQFIQSLPAPEPPQTAPSRSQIIEWLIDAGLRASNRQPAPLPRDVQAAIRTLAAFSQSKSPPPTPKPAPEPPKAPNAVDLNSRPPSSPPPTLRERHLLDDGPTFDD